MIALLPCAEESLASNWLSQPYEVQIWYAPQQVADMLAICNERFEAEVERTLRAVIGRAWSINSKVIASAEAFLGQESEPVPMHDEFEFEHMSTRADKVFVVGILADRGGYQVGIRELDGQVLMWGAPARISAVQSAELAVRVAQGILAAFRPIAKIGRVRQGEAVLEVRAGMLASSSSPLLPSVNSVMQPIICKVNSARDGNAKNVQPVPWTVLVVKSVANSRVIGELVSGMRAPLRTRTSREVERYALAFVPTLDSTVLELRSSGGDAKPLIGYDVLARPYGDLTTRYVGRSDFQGEVRLVRSPQMLSTFYVKHGGRLLVKLPIVVGQQPALSVELDDDSLCMTVEGFLKGVEDRLIDAIVVRETQIQRIRQRILFESQEEVDLERISAAIKKARQSDRRQELLRLMRSRQTEFRSSDRKVQDRIDRMFSELKGAIQRGFDPAPLEQLEYELEELRAQFRRRTEVQDKS